MEDYFVILGVEKNVSVKSKHLLDTCNIDFNLVKRAGELKILLGDMLAKIDVEKMEKVTRKAAARPGLYLG